MRSKKSWFLILVSVFIVVMAGFVVYTGYTKYHRNKQIEKEIRALQKQADELAGGNALLQEKIAYFQSPEFAERQAKEKLNLKKPDERVVVIAPQPEQEVRAVNQEQTITKEVIKDTRSNPKKWWAYFFAPRSSSQ